MQQRHEHIQQPYSEHACAERLRKNARAFLKEGYRAMAIDRFYVRVQGRVEPPSGQQ